MAIDMHGSCKSCRWFDKLTDDGGHCRRFPPTVLAVLAGRRWEEDTGQTSFVEQHWPYVVNSDQCGEYK